MYVYPHMRKHCASIKNIQRQTQAYILYICMYAYILYLVCESVMDVTQNHVLYI